MKRIKCLLLFAFTVASAQSQTLSKEDRESVQKFIRHVINNRSDLIASEMSFPLRRQYPLPEIKDSADFVSRFNQVFDEELINTIKRSSLSNDWSHVGWRGIMLSNGTLWLDEDGRLTAVNHQSKYEAELRQQLIKAEKNKLDISIRDYLEPLYILQTEQYRIRIDKLQDQSYRYTSWKKEAKIESKPDLVLSNGEIKFDGSGGNHTYTFTSGEFKYEIDFIVMGETNSPDAILSVFKNGKEIVKQAATVK